MQYPIVDASALWSNVKKVSGRQGAVFAVVRGTMVQPTNASPTVTTLLTSTRIATTSAARDLPRQPFYDENRRKQFI